MHCKPHGLINPHTKYFPRYWIHPAKSHSIKSVLRPVISTCITSLRLTHLCTFKPMQSPELMPWCGKNMAQSTTFSMFLCVSENVCICHLDVSFCAFARARSHIPLAEGLRRAGWTWPTDVQFTTQVVRQVTGALAAWNQRPRDLEVSWRWAGRRDGRGGQLSSWCVFSYASVLKSTVAVQVLHRTTELFGRSWSGSRKKTKRLIFEYMSRP